MYKRVHELPKWNEMKWRNDPASDEGNIIKQLRIKVEKSDLRAAGARNESIYTQNIQIYRIRTMEVKWNEEVMPVSAY